MRADRRTFLKIAGITISGLEIRPASRALAGGASAPAPQASTLLKPLTPKPLVGSRWAIAIDVAKCLSAEGCTDCIAACNQAHNIPHLDDPRHEIKWIWKTPYEDAFAEGDEQFTPPSLRGKLVPVLCNHCDDPACVRVCPTQATWKRADGIVMMDYHRCIGCRFCMAACPYGSRSFNWVDPRLALDLDHLTSDYPTRTRGVVEKCDLCEERLAKGLIPACVDACKARALVFGDLEDPGSQVSKVLQSHYSIVRKPDLGTRPQVYYIV